MQALAPLAKDEESFARAVNEAGLVVGISIRDAVGTDGDFHAVTWSGLEPLALPNLGHEQCVATDVNDAGQISGFATDPAVMKDRAVLWEDGEVFNAGASEAHDYNRGEGISPTGLLVGHAWDALMTGDAVVYDGHWTAIGGLEPFQQAAAFDANAAGQVVGLQSFPTGFEHAALWDLGTSEVLDLGTLPGHDYAELYDINEAGLAVGRSFRDLPPDSRAVLYDGRSLVDLHDVLPPELDLWLWEAQEINERGDIAATAVVDGQWRAVLLLAGLGSPPWSDLGFGLAGVSGVPALSGSGPLTPGSTGALDLSGAAPSAPAALFVSLEAAPTPFKGGALVPMPIALQLPLGTDGTGSIGLAWSAWPGALSGLTLFLQCAVQDGAAVAGVSLSNALRADVP
jgi:uncharacterized membrane protein